MNALELELGLFSSEPEHSYTIPGRYYYDLGVFEQEKTAIFYRTWQYICHLSRLEQTGQYVVRDIADQSVVVLRDDTGELRAFHNVCQHRAHRLLEGEGKLGKAITCPYHAWSYHLSGKLRYARGNERVSGFPFDKICLNNVRVEVFCGFVFVNFDQQAAPMAEVYAGLEEEIRTLSPQPERLKRAHQCDYNLQANWKNSIENYSECYHCPNRHPSFVSGGVDIRSYRIKTYPAYHSHRSHDRGDQQSYALGDSSAASVHEFGSWLVWPNLSLEVYPGGNLTVFHHVPVSPEQTLQVTEWFFPAEIPTPEEQAAIDFVHIVREEDIPICESVQKGLHSLGYRQGRFIVDAERSDISEHAVHDFQLKVVTALQ